MLDERGEVVSFKKTVYTESHQLIEELMLPREPRGRGTGLTPPREKEPPVRLPHPRRPDAEKIDELAVFLRAIGYDLTVSKTGTSQKDLNRILGQVKGKPEERLITTATVRSMAKAVYTTKNIGHYGLAFDDYAHFTSPIPGIRT